MAPSESTDWNIKWHNLCDNWLHDATCHPVASCTSFVCKASCVFRHLEQNRIDGKWSNFDNEKTAKHSHGVTQIMSDLAIYPWRCKILAEIKWHGHIWSEWEVTWDFCVRPLASLPTVCAAKIISVTLTSGRNEESGAKKTRSCASEVVCNVQSEFVAGEIPSWFQLDKFCLCAFLFIYLFSFLSVKTTVALSLIILLSCWSPFQGSDFIIILFLSH